MGLIDKAKRDIERITSDLNGWAVALLFETPTGETAAISGRFTKITLPNEEPEGTSAATLQAHVSFSEKFLIDLGYPVRNADGKVHMDGHLVTATDSTGTAERYLIRTWEPDETIGLIICMLGEYTPGT